MNEFNNDDYRNMMPDYSEDERYYYENIAIRVGFGRRLLAYIIDLITLTALMSVIVMIMVATGYLESNGVDIKSFGTFDLLNSDSLMTFSLLIAPFSAMLNLLYFSTEIFLGASVGKILLKIKIASDTRYESDIQTLVIRYAVKNSNTIMTIIALMTAIGIFQILGTFFGIVVFIGFFGVLFEQKKALHDYIAKTAVFYKEDIAPLEYTEINQA